MNTPDFGGAVTDCASLAAFDGSNLCENKDFGPKCCASCARQNDCVDSNDADVIAKLKEGFHFDFGAKDCASLLTYNGGSLCNDPEYKPYCCATCKALLPSAPPPSPPPSASPSPPPSAAPSPPPSLAPSPPPSVATTQPTVTDPPATDPPPASPSPPPSPAPSPPLTEVETTVTLTATADDTLDEDAVVQTLANDLGVDPERITLVPSFDGTLDEGAEANVTVVVKVEDNAEAEAVEKELNALDDGEKTDAFGDSFKVTAVAEVVVTAPAPSPPPAETQTCDCEDANKSDDCASTCDAIVAAVGLVGGALIAVIAVPIVVVGLIGLLVLYCCCCKGDSKQPTPTAEVEMPAAQPTESHV